MLTLTLTGLPSLLFFLFLYFSGQSLRPLDVIAAPERATRKKQIQRLWLFRLGGGWRVGRATDFRFDPASDSFGCGNEVNAIAQAEHVRVTCKN